VTNGGGGPVSAGFAPQAASPGSQCAVMWLALFDVFANAADGNSDTPPNVKTPDARQAAPTNVLPLKVPPHE
jgi:hypothetical protein